MERRFTNTACALLLFLITSSLASIRLIPSWDAVLAAAITDAVVSSVCPTLRVNCTPSTVINIGIELYGLHTLMSPLGFDVRTGLNGDEFVSRRMNSSPTSPVLISLFSMVDYSILPHNQQAADAVRFLTRLGPSLIVFAEPSPGECEVTHLCSSTRVQYPSDVWVSQFILRGYVLAVNETIAVKNSLFDGIGLLSPHSWTLAKNILLFRPIDVEAIRTRAPTQFSLPLHWLHTSGTDDVTELLARDWISYQAAVRAGMEATPSHVEEVPFTPQHLTAALLNRDFQWIRAALTLVLRELQLKDLSSACEWTEAILSLLQHDLHFQTEDAPLLEYSGFLYSQAIACGWETTQWVFSALLRQQDISPLQLLFVSVPNSDQYIVRDQLWSTNLSDHSVAWLGQMNSLVLEGALVSPSFHNGLRRTYIEMIQIRSSEASAGFRRLYGMYYTAGYVLQDASGYINNWLTEDSHRLVQPVLSLLPFPPVDKRWTSGRLTPLRSILVVCGRWMVLHSTHRTLSPFVNQLKNEFRVTLFFQRTKLHNETNADVSGFHFVRFAPEELTDNMLYTELSWIRQQAFDIIFFPEFGVRSFDMLLAAARLAPVHIASYGSSGSTHSTDIDYFIGGYDTEFWSFDENFARQSHPNPQHRYSERLLTIAGIGAVFDSTLDRKPSNVTLLTSEIVINIPCSASKINSHKLLTTADIIKRSWTILSAEAVATGSPPVTLRLRFFSNIHGGKRVAIAALVAQLKRSLANPSIAPPGAVAIEVLPTLARQEFIAKSAEGHLALDSYPFGGCLTVIDTLNSGVPILVKAGGMWNNRIAPAILLRLGLSESVSYSKQEFITQAVELITHSQKRQALRGKVSALSFQPLFNTSEAKGYIPAFRVAYVATLAQPRLLAQYPSVAGVGYEECILYVLTALPSLTSIPSDSELEAIAEAICYDLLYPLQPAEVNMYGGPLRNGPPIQIPQHMV